MDVACLRHDKVLQITHEKSRFADFADFFSRLLTYEYFPCVVAFMKDEKSFRNDNRAAGETRQRPTTSSKVVNEGNFVGLFPSALPLRRRRL